MADSYETVRKAFLSDIPDDIDKREGSICYIMASATAMAVKTMYDYIESLERSCFIETAEDTYLNRLAVMFGLSRRGKTNAVVKVETEGGLAVGDKLASENMTYTVQSVENGYFTAQADVAGCEANDFTGEVLVKNRSDIEEVVKISEVIAKGADEEDDETLRSRIIERARCPLCPGNVSYYKELADKITGVGGRRVIPVREDTDVIKLVITDEDYNVADENLVAYAQSQLDPSEFSGLGYEMAPFGHKVKVESVKKVDVDITVEIEGAASDTYYLRLARSKLKVIFKEINKEWDKVKNIVLRDRVIEDCFLNLGVDDINVVSMNQSVNRIILEPNEILGDVKINGA